MIFILFTFKCVLALVCDYETENRVAIISLSVLLALQLLIEYLLFKFKGQSQKYFPIVILIVVVFYLQLLDIKKLQRELKLDYYIMGTYHGIIMTLAMKCYMRWYGKALFSLSLLIYLLARM